MPPSRTIVVVGAGIGGLTAALAIANRGLRVALLEQAETLEETGAGIQLTPNATRILIDLGLRQRLARTAITPEALRIVAARTGDEITRMPIGTAAEKRYGAPYWVIHRGDLQAALLELVIDHPDVELSLGTRVADCAVHLNGVTVGAMRDRVAFDSRGIAVVGADGLWSTVRTRLGDATKPTPARRTAWRALVPAEAVAPQWREPIVNLWLGPDSHLVHYPVKAGRMINIVAIISEGWLRSGWNAPGKREDLLRRFEGEGWALDARTLLAAPDHWLKWALADRPPAPRTGGKGPVTLLGDAAHPMLPFLAQGAAMAIEDADALAEQFSAAPDNPVAAMRAYERQRHARVTHVQRQSRFNGRIYQLDGMAAQLRNLALRAMGGPRLLHRYDWLYDRQGG